MRSLRAEVLGASTQEARAYLLGASRDGTFSHLHNTLRISQHCNRACDPGFVSSDPCGRIKRSEWKNYVDVSLINSIADLVMGLLASLAG